MSELPTEPIRATATRTRQGRWGRHMVWVLAVSVLLSLVAVVVAWLWISGDLAGSQHNSTPTKRDAAGFHAPPPPSS
ncbi:MAG: hypothetical protein ACR2FH_03455 [Caulobacteraceae bacterium]